MSGHQLPYKSQSYEMTNTIFQSMVNNIGTRIRKMELTLQFKSLEEKQLFANKKQEEKEKNQSDLYMSDEEQNQQEAQNQQNSSRQKKGANVPSKQNDQIVIPQNFEMSILLRQKFMKKLNAIGDRLNVKFMVVPNKVKIEGRLMDRVDDAQDQYRQLREDICLQCINQYGQEIYQSQYYKNLLAEQHIEVLQILKKYYFWFTKSKVHQPHKIIQKIFKIIMHRFYSLTRPIQAFFQKQMPYYTHPPLTTGKTKVVHGSSIISFNNRKILNQLIKNTRVRLFYTIIKKQVNFMQENEDMHVELSQDNNNLIMHLKAQQQFQMQVKDLNELYRKYKHVCFMFPEAALMTAFQQSLEKFNAQNNVNKFKKLKNEEKVDSKSCHLIWQIKQNYTCISYELPSQQLDNEALQQHSLLRFIRSLHKDLLCFKIVLDYFIEVPEEEEWSKSFIFQKGPENKGTVIGCKNLQLSRFQNMIKLFLANKFSKEYIVKVKLQKTKQNFLQNSISMDITKPINQSSYMMADLTKNNEPSLNQSILNQSIKNQILPSDIHSNTMFKYQKYNVCINISPEDIQKRWADIQKVERSKLPWPNKDLEKTLKEITTFQFKLYRIKISKNLKNDIDADLDKLIEEKPELAPYNRRVTIFMKIKEPQNLYEKDKKIKIVKLQKNYGITEGYLLQTNLCYILSESQSQLPFGRYEPIAFIKKME